VYLISRKQSNLFKSIERKVKRYTFIVERAMDEVQPSPMHGYFHNQMNQ
jgi:hypothetical protein